MWADAPIKTRTASARARVMAYVRMHMAEHDDSPSTGEIAAECAMSKPAVCRVLDGLERDGELSRPPAKRGHRRRIVLPEQVARALALLREVGFQPPVTHWELFAPPGLDDLP